MAQHSVNVQVQKQANTEACWASVVVAIMQAMRPGVAVIAPDDLYSHWHRGTGRTAQDPIDVLDQHFGVACDLTRFPAKPAAGAAARNQRAADIEAVVAAALSRAVPVPVLCGLSPHNDERLGTTAREWRHAVLIYQCDTTAKTCKFKDPSPGGPHAGMADRKVSFGGLASGFDYMARAHFGPNARRAFGVTEDGAVHARCFRLIVPRA